MNGDCQASMIEMAGVARAGSVPPEFDLSELLKRNRLYGDCSPCPYSPPEQVVILVDRKPIALDTILPLAFELRAEQPKLPIIWLVKNRAYYEDIRRNYVLWEGMQRTGRIAAFGGRGPGGRLRQLAWLYRLRRRRTVLLNHGDFASSPMDLLAMSVRRGGGRLIGYARWCYPMSSIRLRGIINNQLAHGGRREHYRYSGDAWLIPHPLQAAHVATLVNSPLVVAGTPRCFPAWNAYLDAYLKRGGILDLQGQAIDCNGGTVFSIFYPGNYPLPDLTTPTACRDQLLKVLEAIRSQAPVAKVLVKPHTICKLSELRQDLSPFSDLDIRVTYAHPQLLARVSRAAFFTNGSNVMDDMYVAGVPVIETARYRDWVREGAGSQFPNCGRLAATELAEIEGLVSQIMQRPGSVPRAQLMHLTWPKAKSISACLWGEAPVAETTV